MYQTIGIIIPAYNERANLQLLLPKILTLYPGINVLVVDDSNEKETNRLKDLISVRAPGVAIYSRHKKSGRGSAIRDGMKEFLKNPNIQWIMEMDADLAHKPEEIRLFLGKKDKADLIIGSRYLKRSHIIRWPLYRLIQSKIINAFLRLWLGLPISDYTNGFRLYSRRAVEALLACRLKEHGYIALSEMAYALKKRGFRISEIPTTFTDRTYGKSNADTKELFRSLLGALLLRFRLRY